MAQFCLLGASSGCLIITILTFLTGRAWGLPFRYEVNEHFPFVQLVVPVLIGSFGNGVMYLTSSKAVQDERRIGKIGLVAALAPAAIFLLLFISVTLTFWLCNRPGSETFFSIDEYSGWVASLSAMLSFTSPVVYGQLERLQ